MRRSPARRKVAVYRNGVSTDCACVVDVTNIIGWICIEESDYTKGWSIEAISGYCIYNG